MSPLQGRTRLSLGTRVFTMAWVPNWHRANLGATSVPRFLFYRRYRTCRSSRQRFQIITVRSGNVYIEIKQTIKNFGKLLLNIQVPAIRRLLHSSIVFQKTNLFQNFCLAAGREEEDKFKHPSVSYNRCSRECILAFIAALFSPPDFLLSGRI